LVSLKFYMVVWIFHSWRDKIISLCLLDITTLHIGDHSCSGICVFLVLEEF
jgi:hypothetical protein